MLPPKFQFTHPRGVRLGVDPSDKCIHTFQFTHPRGVRLILAPTCNPLAIGFNSRTHAGCDIISFNEQYIYFPVSIHAPTRGATFSFRQLSMLQNVSIHAPTRGATSGRDIPDRVLHCFNSRTHAGCDVIAATHAALYSAVSIHAPTRGATIPPFST